MNITLAIPIFHGGENLCDALIAIKNQRVIHADIINLYLVSTTLGAHLQEVIDTGKLYNVNTIILSKDESRNRTTIFRKIINDTDVNDILITLAEDAEIDPSGISELFKFFLRYNDLAVVTGRQYSPLESPILTRFFYNFFYPLTQKNYPVWHLMRIRTSFDMAAFRVNLLKKEDIMPPPELKYFPEIYIAGKFAERGLRSIYNPLASTLTHRTIRPSLICRSSYALCIFLKTECWLSKRWHIRRSDGDIFFAGYQEYLVSGSSIPFIQTMAIFLHMASNLCVLAARIHLHKEKMRNRKLLKLHKNRRTKNDQ